MDVVDLTLSDDDEPIAGGPSGNPGGTSMGALGPRGEDPVGVRGAGGGPPAQDPPTARKPRTKAELLRSKAHAAGSMRSACDSDVMDSAEQPGSVGCTRGEAGAKRPRLDAGDRTAGVQGAAARHVVAAAVGDDLGPAYLAPDDAQAAREEAAGGARGAAASAHRLPTKSLEDMEAELLAFLEAKASGSSGSGVGSSPGGGKSRLLPPAPAGTSAPAGHRASAARQPLPPASPPRAPLAPVPHNSPKRPSVAQDAPSKAASVHGVAVAAPGAAVVAAAQVNPYAVRDTARSASAAAPPLLLPAHTAGATGSRHQYGGGSAEARGEGRSSSMTTLLQPAAAAVAAAAAVPAGDRSGVGVSGGSGGGGGGTGGQTSAAAARAAAAAAKQASKQAEREAKAAAKAEAKAAKEAAKHVARVDKVLAARSKGRAAEEDITLVASTRLAAAPLWGRLAEALRAAGLAHVVEEVAPPLGNYPLLSWRRRSHTWAEHGGDAAAAHGGGGSGSQHHPQQQSVQLLAALGSSLAGSQSQRDALDAAQGSGLLAVECTDVPYIMLCLPPAVLVEELRADGLRRLLAAAASQRPDATLAIGCAGLEAHCRRAEQQDFRAGTVSFSREAVFRGLHGALVSCPPLRFREWADDAQAADSVTGLTVALARQPFKAAESWLEALEGKKKALSAELEAAREELGPAARGWQAALQRVPNVCPRHAIAVSRVYPSLGALMCAYERLGPGDEAGRAKLLVGLRAASVDHQGGGGGSSRSNSAMGAVVSSRLAALLWADDPEARFNDQGDEAAAD